MTIRAVFELMIFDISLSRELASHRTQLPLPDKNILERNFNQLLGSLDLPNDKITEMNSYDDHKKWEILCSRSLMKVHQSPSFYLQRLKGLFGIRSTQPKTDVAEILRGLEVSLRTYDKDWFQKFLNEKDSLNTLVGLMSSCNLSSENFQILLQCLKVIMMDVDGFEKAINHQTLFDVLIANLPSAAMGNKSTLLQLLTIGCKRENRHEFILKSLRSIVGLEKLMDFLNINKNFESPKVIIAALKLIDAVINAPADMNYRVYLHYEFNKIGLHNQIERLTLNESTLIPEIMAEIKEHKSQVINVNQLIKDHEDIRDTKEKLRRALVKIKEMESQSINYVRQSPIDIILFEVTKCNRPFNINFETFVHNLVQM